MLDDKIKRARENYTTITIEMTRMEASVACVALADYAHAFGGSTAENVRDTAWYAKSAGAKILKHL